MSRWNVLRPLWAQWRCRHCNSLIAVDIPRRVLGIVMYVPAVLFAFFTLTQWGAPQALIILGIFVLWLPIFLLTEALSVVERRGLLCNECGYDLRGQTLPRCPECGSELDDRLRALLAGAAEPPPRRAARLGRVLTIVAVLALFVIVGMQAFLMARRSARAGRAATATAPTTRPAP